MLVTSNSILFCISLARSGPKGARRIRKIRRRGVGGRDHVRVIILLHLPRRRLLLPLRRHLLLTNQKTVLHPPKRRRVGSIANIADATNKGDATKRRMTRLKNDQLGQSTMAIHLQNPKHNLLFSWLRVKKMTRSLLKVKISLKPQLLSMKWQRKQIFRTFIVMLIEYIWLFNNNT